MIGVDPRHTSDRCEACDHPARENRVKRRCSDASAVGTRPTPMNTPPATSSGLDWPFSQPTKLGEKKLAALAVREVTKAAMDSAGYAVVPKPLRDATVWDSNCSRQVAPLR